MSSEAIGLVVPDRNNVSDVTMDVVNVDAACPSPKTRETTPKLIGLHSPPDSNNAAKLDGSDSELSDIEDMDEPPKLSTPPATEPVDDIGEVLPADWSGAVPIFKPTMHQFKDFKRFVWPPPLSLGRLCLWPTLLIAFRVTTDGEDRLVWHEIRNRQDRPSGRMEGLAAAAGRPREDDPSPRADQTGYHGI
jgi:hypothetical protein